MVRDIEALTGGHDRALRQLSERLSGELMLPGHDDFDSARTVWNAEADRYPAVIVRPEDETDVINAVHFARQSGLPLAVRSGGHSMAGYGTVDGGLVIDFSRMRRMDIDPVRRVARVQTGRTWAEYAEAAHEYGLATSSGDMGTVGIGGLTLGGGIGWMVRKYGLTIDHLRSVDMVTADGQLLTASADENPDLFWGLRGGGGNFGIATSFELTLDPAGLIVGGAVFYPMCEARDVLRRFVEYAPAAPEELTTMAMFMHAPPAPFIPPEQQGKMVLAILGVYAGDVEEGQTAVAPLGQLGTPIVNLFQPMPYPAIFEMAKEGGLKGTHHDVRTMYLTSLDETVRDIVVDQTAAMTGPLGMAQIRVLGGAMSRVPADATAFAHRDKPFMLTISNAWQGDEGAEIHRASTERFWRAIHPHASGAYVNFLADEGEERVREAYPAATYERLVALKNRYDPTNVFNLNQNIKPTA